MPETRTDARRSCSRPGKTGIRSSSGFCSPTGPTPTIRRRTGGAVWRGPSGRETRRPPGSSSRLGPTSTPGTAMGRLLYIWCTHGILSTHICWKRAQSSAVAIIIIVIVTNSANEENSLSECSIHASVISADWCMDDTRKWQPSISILASNHTHLIDSPSTSRNRQLIGEA